MDRCEGAGSSCPVPREAEVLQAVSGLPAEAQAGVLRVSGAGDDARFFEWASYFPPNAREKVVTRTFRWLHSPRSSRRSPGLASAWMRSVYNWISPMPCAWIGA